MKIFTNKKIVQKVIIAIVIVLSFNFIAPTYSQADVGGILAGPIIDFVTMFFDAAMSAFQYFMYDGQITMLDTAGAALNAGLTIINPFDTFLLERAKGREQKFNEKLSEYDADVTQEEIDENSKNKTDEELEANKGADITISADEFDVGWIGAILPFGWGDKAYGVPIIKYTPEKIFANKVPSLDVNFINPKQWNNEDLDNKSITQALHSTIANWYVALRNLAIVALLSVLLYVGIRMVISSSAADKSKYKQMLMDWIVALCIVFFLHYVMSFILTITQMITEGVDSGTEIIVRVTDSEQGDFMFKTDLTGLCRLQIQYSNLGARMIYLIFYIGLVVYTLMFTLIYIRRTITMAFLTLMAPLVAITYPIDKIGDGKAQAFGIWIKEFIFNALLQPFHLIIYTIFLGAASEITTKNPIFAILFLASIIPSEKLLRKMFGFEKASTAGSFAAGFGGAAAFNLISKGAKALAGGNSKGGSKQSNGNNRVRTSNNTVSDNAPQGYEAFANGNSNNAQSNSQNEQPQNNENPNAQQRMVEAYDENYGTDEFDHQERDAMAREAYAGEGMNYSEEEYRDILRDTGYSEDEINEMVSNDPRYSSSQTQQTEQQPVQSGNSNQTPTRGRRVINGFASLGRATFNGKNARRLARFAGRAAVRTVTTGVGTAIGLGVGIAGGDLNDVITYGAAGAALGNRVLGNAALNGLSGIRNAGSGIANTFAEGYYGVNEAAVRRQSREFNRNEEMRNYLSEEFTTEDDQRLSGRELDNLMDRASYYNNAGITEKSDIKKSLKLEDSIKGEMANMNISEEEKTNMAREQSATIAKIADRVDEKKLMSDDKYAKGLHDNFKRGLKSANANMNEADLERQADHMMKLLKKYKKID